MRRAQRLATSRSSTLPEGVPRGAEFNVATDELTRAIKRNRLVALVVAVIGTVGIAAGIYLGGKATAVGADKIEASHYSVVMLAFELVRTAAAAALIGAFVWGMLNLARAALDQATRFEKRYVAGHFLVYVLHMFEHEIKNGDIKIADTMSVFKAWNDSVDSAYTHVKFGAKNNQGVAFSGSDKGLSFAGSSEIRVGEASGGQDHP